MPGAVLTLFALFQLPALHWPSTGFSQTLSSWPWGGKEVIYSPVHCVVV